jgi:excisionase family DNA binding protein
MELTTVQAADFLQVSRPHVIKLIDEGKLPCRFVGTHRRLKLKDLIDYGAKKATDGRRAREEMTKEAEQLGWGY